MNSIGGSEIDEHFKKSPDESLKIKTKYVRVGVKRNPGKNKFINNVYDSKQACP